jgi:lipoprotein-anchoring transpeptidase ErfK/SrfK
VAAGCLPRVAALALRHLWTARPKKSRLKTLLLSVNRQSFYPYRAAAFRPHPGRCRRDGVHEMISRIMAGILSAAILSFGVLMATGVTAAAQANRHTAEPPASAYLDQQVAPSAGFFDRLFGTAAASVQRAVVPFTGRERPGTIIISTPERRLYLVLPSGQALRYGIGVGRIGFTWAGTTAVSMKREWPDWTPPEQMLQRRPDLPRHMAGGVDNPLGARALYLGSSLYRIHGSNEPDTIGTAVSSGCFRMTNDDVIDLYNRVPVGTKVIVMQ